MAIMIGGAIIKATTFVGGIYLAKYLSGESEADKAKKLTKTKKSCPGKI